MSYATLSHRFDVLTEQMADELPEVEAPNRGVACGQGGGVGLHAALAELASLFGMADEGFDPSTAVTKWCIRQRAFGDSYIPQVTSL
jgi:hypothetical protein